MGLKKLKLLLALSVLCLVCVVSEAYFKGYIKFEYTKENSKDITENLVSKSTQKPENTETAVKVTKPNSSQKVRILIMSGNFASYYHGRVKLTCNSEFTVTTGKKITKYKAGKEVFFTMPKKSAKQKKFTVKSVNGQGIKILSFKRQDIHPVYRGMIEIRRYKKGFLIVNELPLEQYLYAVVPSEIPAESSMEALKAQAVCARSYAYNQIGEKRYTAYGADLDDSVACQVYNNIPEDKRSTRAVDETCGQVVTMNGKIIITYYFSTSWGCTADGKDVWNTSKEVPYLLGSLQLRKKGIGNNDTIDLSSENAFKSFLNSDNYTTYDSDGDWYRWHITLNSVNLSKRINAALHNCYLSNKSLVLTQSKNGKYVQKPLKNIGKVKKLRIEKREKSGLVTELVIVGTGNVVKVRTQYNIRKVLAPIREKINIKNGKSLSSYLMLPSAAFYVDAKQSKKNTIFKIIGGGFGHGTGLSQTGAVAMAESGESYKTILEHYFKGTNIQDVRQVLK